ncbi:MULTISPECIES: response regulator [Pseudoalteromonas]|jgi:DNA-binding NtrC family response regulator|uniref:Response regulator n=3 Tax=Pseudoalteromonas TaxID=53246 RepID=A0AAD0XC93_9GAMM|nr:MULTISPECIES: response regulator [Pseudoalteromonas]MAJ39598.1 response regulator [Pseudoalteromonadaceae bacterium]MCP4055893.1 response regulator [Pseudoalteromonas sp.]MDC9520475.1 response regulator [Pseudoalteromonas sp. Angola-31]MDY6886647.1 response regulator [Pseudomonadota bacterium]OUX90014.1 MAG: response regulator [Pseudoalteromonas sp. TMED43]|tara:strand:- start:64 stop:447 length:384 start_codon:yes stop_codon:yes gene_type:complete
MDTQLSILIVDDVSTVRSFLSQTLMHLGIENVKEASTAKQCISECQAANYNMIFLDIELPDGDGKELIAQINDINPETNVVMVSAHSAVENVKEAIDKGAKGFVVKPFTPKKIAAMLKKFYPDLENV